MTARFSWNEQDARGHRPRLQKTRSTLDTAQEFVQLIEVDGFCQISLDTFLGCKYGDAGVFDNRHDDDGLLRLFLVDAGDKIEAARTGHDQVEQNHIKVGRLNILRHLLRVCRREDLMAGTREPFGNDRQDFGFVINDEDFHNSPYPWAPFRGASNTSRTLIARASGVKGFWMNSKGSRFR